MPTQTFYKDFSIHCFSLKMEERRRLPSHFLFRTVFWAVGSVRSSAISFSSRMNECHSWRRKTVKLEKKKNTQGD